MTNLDTHPVTSGTPKPRVKGDFYPLQKVELIALRKARLINNTAFVYLAVRYEHPYSDRPIRIRTKTFSIEWGIPESSLYEAIATLKREKVIKIHTRELVIEWNAQQDSNSGNPESILGCHSPFRESREHSGDPEKPAAKAKSYKGFGQRSRQTFKTFKRSNTEGCVENKEQGETAREQEEQHGDGEVRRNLTLSPAPSLTSSTPTQNSELNTQNSQLPPLLQQAKALKVNLNDTKLKSAIATFPERVPTALAALAEKPSGTVRSPTRFLETAIRDNWQPETSLNPAFNHWFTEAKQHGCPIAGAEFKGGVQWIISTKGHHVSWEKLHALTWEQIYQQLQTPPPLDLSSTLIAIDCEVDRLNWSLEQTRSFLQQTYGKPHREMLTDEELFDFLHRLETAI